MSDSHAEPETSLVRMGGRRIAIHVLLFGCVSLLGLAWHELAGHGLTTLLMGGRIDRLELLWVQVWPDVEWQGRREGDYFLWGSIEISGVTGDTANALMSLAGSMSTFTVSILATLVLWLRAWRGFALTLLISLSVWWFDLTTYLIASLGVRQLPVIGPLRPSEPYHAAVALGMRGGLFIFSAYFVSGCLALALMWRLRVLKRESPKPAASQ